MSKTQAKKSSPTVIKKYANRRLYDTGRSSYVTLEDLREMVQEGHDFVVLDSKTEEDLTRSVLTQIIADKEAEEETLLPTSFLRTLIGFYGDNAQAAIPPYLEQTMAFFAQNQEKIQEHVNKSFDDMRKMSNMDHVFPSASSLEDITRKNMELFENAMKVMPPFNMGYMGASSDEEKSKK